MLSAERQQAVQKAGTWSQIFPPSAIQNRSPVVGVALWWGFLMLLGWIAYPFIRIALPGLDDCGYPFARLAGLLLLAYPTWLAGSYGISVTRGMIAIVLSVLAFISINIAWFDRHSLLREIQSRKKYILLVEILALTAFGTFLLIRLLNPEIEGSEKPMDLSYLTAVLKSETYPPYDPWFAGGVMNYYYYGFVIIGLPVKLLGITPSFAYNLIIPTLFSMVILGAFSIGWNINRKKPWIGGVFTALAVTVLGNLGAVRMVWQGWQKLASAAETTSSASILQNIQLAISGASMWLSGQKLPYSNGDWYWIPSRAVIPAPNFEITEFPFFTFLYADLHAHMIALPITLLTVAWSLSTILSFAKGEKIHRVAWGMIFGALVVGCLRAANAWDHPTYLVLSCLSLGYALSLNIPGGRLKPRGVVLIRVFTGIAVFIGLSFLFFAPFNASFRQAYSQILPWQGVRVNLASYLIHWGLFLFILAVWLFDELTDWVSCLQKGTYCQLKKYRSVIIILAWLLTAISFRYIERNIPAIAVIVPLGLTCTLLLFQREQPNHKRFAFFLAGTGLALTFFVEIITLQGDRMNTVFKFYFQAWTFLAISAAAGLSWILQKNHKWHRYTKIGVCFALTGLVAGCVFTTLTSTWDRIFSKTNPAAPYSLDGMAYMSYASLVDGPEGATQKMDLSEDARAIRWLQENAQGTPVIVEAHTGSYRHWGTRFTIFTGLPGVIGWEIHQRQQRSVLPGDPVGERIQQVKNFYLTTDRAVAEDFVNQYMVEYIIIGQLERIFYPGPGLEKFQELSGDLWNLVYSDNNTFIYQVSP